MPIIAAAGPEDGAERVGNTLAAMGVAGLGSAEAGGATEMLVGQPIPIFVVDIETLAATGASALGEARRTGWRYLAQHGDGLAVVDVPEDRESDSEMLMGGEVGGNLANSGQLAEVIAADEGDYEARILDLNLIGDSVLWLHSGDGGSDRFITLGAEPREVPETNLIERLRRNASAKLMSMRAAEGEAGG